MNRGRQQRGAIDESKILVNHFKLELSENSQKGTKVYKYNVEEMIRNNPTNNEQSIALPRRYLKSCVEDAVKKLKSDHGPNIDKQLAFDRETTNFIHFLKLFDFQNVEGDENLTQVVVVEVESLDVISSTTQNQGGRQKINAKITLKFLKEIPLIDVLQCYEAPSHAITDAYDLVIKNDHPDKRHLKDSLDVENSNLSPGLKLWKGLFFKACPGTNNLYAKVDVTFKAQWEELNMSDFQANLRKIEEKIIEDAVERRLKSSNTALSNLEQEKKKAVERNQENIRKKVFQLLSGSLKGLNVKCKRSEDREYIYKVNSVVKAEERLRRPKTINRQEATTVSELMQLSQGINCTQEDLMLHVGPVKKNLYFRLADCTIAPNQANFKILDTEVSKKMVQCASLRPKLLYEDITKLLTIEVGKERLGPFGFKISEKMESIDMRKLPPPTLMYTNREDREARIDNKGKWTIGNSYDFKTAGKSVKHALIVQIVDEKWSRMKNKPNRKDLEHFALKFLGESNRWKIGIDKYYISDESINAGSTLQWLAALEAEIILKSQEVQTGKKFDMIIAITPKSKEIHACVKRVLEVEFNILTQCIIWDTFDKIRFSNGAGAIMNNMMLKFNAKLNGVNHVLRENKSEACLPAAKILVMGAAIGSPIRESKVSKVPHSIATVTCNIDQDLFRYSTQWRLQKSESGEILDLKTMVKWHLENYKTPSSSGNRENLRYIIFYRDCSEAVVNEKVERVYKSELRAIEEAVKEFPGLDGKISIVYVLVQRPNHTKFFQNVKISGSDVKDTNVMPGVIVDRKITHPSYYNFFLLSHSGSQGTMKPTEYTIMSQSPEEKTENGRLAQLTYSLCFMYSRCTQSIPIPAPVCYAKRWSGKALTYVLRHNVNWNNEKDCARLGVILNERTTELLKKTFKGNFDLSNIDPFC
ncbi:Hypothetical predicted protein [Cloeon dipterum]|uniref:Piwi domain-containing protein n=1 Tax=Cloeon dipterum TaxID=197152 RepID=A0A8S1CVE3_9INSE|nr:Hypothetical predicted protein [Cloeon dipterum]